MENLQLSEMENKIEQMEDNVRYLHEVIQENRELIHLLFDELGKHHEEVEDIKSAAYERTFIYPKA